MYLGIVQIRLCYLYNWKNAVMTFNIIFGYFQSIHIIDFCFVFANSLICIDLYFNYEWPHPHPGMTTQNYLVGGVWPQSF